MIIGKEVRVFMIDDDIARYAHSGIATLDAINASFIVVTVDKGEPDEFTEIIPMHQISSIDTLKPLGEE
jgi:hypothetical protein